MKRREYGDERKRRGIVNDDEGKSEGENAATHQIKIQKPGHPPDGERQ